MLRARAEAYVPLAAAARAISPEDDLWTATQLALGELSLLTDDTAVTLGHFAAVRNAPRADPRERACAMHQLANTFMNTGRIPEGIAEAHRALDLARSTGDAENEASALLNLGLAAYYTDDLDSAIMWARQACQIDPAAFTGETARASRLVLTIALTEAGEIEEAGESNGVTLDMAVEAGDIHAEAFAVSNLAELEMLAGRLPEAWAQLTRASRLALLTGSDLRLRNCLWVGRELCAVTGRWAEVATFETAKATHSRRHDVTVRPAEVQRSQALLRQAADVLGTEMARAAEQRGAAMTLETAVELLLIVAESGSAGPPAVQGQSRAPEKSDGAAGLGQLSRREQELVTLVAQGHTDAQIAGRLYISVSTVRSHLDRIRDKTSCRRRADLTRLALQIGLA
jgi:DNA-binding CsgD family transcriptional regulator